jgi:acetyltransferase-like isoleucine patch superfamily enzyme
MRLENVHKHLEIEAKEIDLGKDVHFGDNISISLNGTFSMGDHSQLGDDIQVRGNNVKIGKYLFHTSGLRVGGGGCQNPTANLSIGDRCTLHNNSINIAEPVKIGNDVGLSHDVTLLTHGYWLSVLDGYPAKFAGIKIGNGVIVGYRSVIMMGVEIVDNVVIGAQSVVTNNLRIKGVYVGNPAKFIRGILPPTREERVTMLREIIDRYLPVARFHGIEPEISIEYPLIYFKEFCFNVETFEYLGEEDGETDDFRDYIRRWGIRIYTERPFRSMV